MQNLIQPATPGLPVCKSQQTLMAYVASLGLSFSPLSSFTLQLAHLSIPSNLEAVCVCLYMFGKGLYIYLLRYVRLLSIMDKNCFSLHIQVDLG